MKLCISHSLYVCVVVFLSILLQNAHNAKLKSCKCAKQRMKWFNAIALKVYHIPLYIIHVNNDNKNKRRHIKMGADKL